MVAANAAFATGTVQQSTKINVKAGTYANTTTSRVFALAGSVTAPVWWSGYNSVPGDLDSSPTVTRTPGTNMPSWTWTTGSVFNPTTLHQIFSSIDFQSASITVGTGNLGSSSGCQFFRCRFTNTGANALSSAVSIGGGTHRFIDCYLQAPSTATALIKSTTGVPVVMGCTFSGGGIGIQTTTGSIFVDKSQFLSVGSHCIQHTGAAATVSIDGCSAYNSSAVGDFYNFSTAPTLAVVSNNVVYGLLYGIDNTSGANTDTVVRTNNSYGSMTSGREFGLGDSPEWDGQTEGSMPFVSSTNLTLLTSAAAYQKAAPGLFENSTTQSFASIGASTPQASDGFIAPAPILVGARNSF